TRVTREVEHIERRGRPSLTARGSTSPQVNFRVSASLLAEAEARANAEGKTVSALAREALERLLHAAA
ncbi:MAG TPA: hypothetical protein VNO54_13330, partial [Streptosporangiaceae bacterium]|nr:hypothetical protein [Streptosporangiaceae bacterium]